MTSPLAWASGLPISRVMSMAKWSARSVSSSKAERRISPRSRGATAAQSAWAATAASSAAAPSSGVALAMVVSGLPGGRVLDVEGRAVGGVAPLAAR